MSEKHHTSFEVLTSDKGTLNETLPKLFMECTPTLPCTAVRSGSGPGSPPPPDLSRASS